MASFLVSECASLSSLDTTTGYCLLLVVHRIPKYMHIIRSQTI